MLDVFAVRFDYLSATFTAESHGTMVAPLLAQQLGMSMLPGRDLHGMQGIASYQVPEGQGTVDLYLQRDGTNRLHFRASGAVTEIATRALQLLEPSFWQGKVTRYDVAVDGLITDEDFDTLAGALVSIAGRDLLRSDGKPAHKITTSVAGDWYGQADGRTLYIGAPSSSIRARFYEKGIQLGGDRNWVRFEWQVRPDAITYVGELTCNPPSDRYKVMYERLTGLDAVPEQLRRVDPETRRGGLKWLEKIAVSMLAKVSHDEREQWLLRVQHARYGDGPQAAGRSAA